MNRFALAVVGLVAACSSGRGVLVYVNSTDANVTQIRVFVGTGGPTTHDLTIAGPHTIAGATYYARDPNDRGDVVALDRPRIVKFEYQTNDDLPLVIAIGYDANRQPIAAGVLHDLAAPTTSNQFNAYQVDLVASPKVFGTTGELQLGLWSNVAETAMDPYTADCAGIQVAGEAASYFVVSPDDQDCDGYTNGDTRECTPNRYNGSVAADRRNPSCLIGSAPGSSDPACAIGGQPCRDGSGPMAGTCNPTNVCAPSSVCTTCLTDFGCAANMMDRVSNAVHYECVIPSDGTKLCQTTLRLERPPTGGIGCSDFQIGTTGFGDTIASGDMKVVASAGADTTTPTSCDAFIETNNGNTLGATSFTGITSFTLNNNGGIALPILFSIASDGCATTQPPVCTIQNDDPSMGAAEDVGMTACAAAWTAQHPVAFAAPVTPAQGGATVTRDGMEMFYASGAVLFEAKRTNSTWVVGPYVSFSTANLTNLRAPKLSADGLRMLFVAESNGMSRLYEVTRQVNGAFGNPVQFTDPSNLPVLIMGASYTESPTTLLVSALTGATGPAHLFRATLTAPHTLDPSGFVPLAINSSDSNDQDLEPDLSFDGLHLYYVSIRAGIAAVYVSSRASVADGFERTVRIAGLSGISNHSYPFVTASGYEMFLASSSALITATRSPLPPN